MNDFSQLQSILGTIALNLPSLLVCLGGAIFAIMRFSRYKKAATTALVAAFVGLVMTGLSILSPLLVQYLISVRSYDAIPTITIVFGIIGSLGGALMIGLLFVAVWLDRKQED